MSPRRLLLLAGLSLAAFSAGCPQCLRIADCTTDGDCASGYYCRTGENICADVRELSDAGVILVDAGRGSSGVSSSHAPGSSSSSAHSASAQPSGSSSSSARSSSQPGSSSSVTSASSSSVPSSSSAASGASESPSSSAGSSASLAGTSAPGASSLASSSAVASSSGIAASSSSVAVPSSSEGLDAGMRDSGFRGDGGSCTDIPLPANCIELVVPAASHPSAANIPLWAPKSAPITTQPAVSLGERVLAGMWLLYADGGTTARVSSHKLGGPCPALEPVDGGRGVIVQTFEDHGEVRFYGVNASGALFEAIPKYSDTGVDLRPAVILGDKVNGLVAAAAENGNVRVVRARGQGSATMVHAGAGMGFVARFCGQGWYDLFAADHGEKVGVYKAVYDGGIALTEAGGSIIVAGPPAAPPVVSMTGTGASLFTFRDSTGRASVQRFQVASPGAALAAPTERELGEGEITGSVAIGVARIGGVLTRVGAVPVTGILRVFSLDDPATGEDWDLRGETLGGVIAIRMRATDDTDTFIAGDSLGTLHAIRDGAALSRFGWPVTGFAAPITQAPAAIRWNNDGRLGLVVVIDTAPKGRYAVLKLGDDTDRPDALSWPEYQRDIDSSGCQPAP